MSGRNPKRNSKILETNVYPSDTTIQTPKTWISAKKMRIFEA